MQNAKHVRREREYFAFYLMLVLVASFTSWLSFACDWMIESAHIDEDIIKYRYAVMFLDTYFAET